MGRNEVEEDVLPGGVFVDRVPFKVLGVVIGDYDTVIKAGDFENPSEGWAFEPNELGRKLIPARFLEWIDHIYEYKEEAGEDWGNGDFPFSFDWREGVVKAFFDSDTLGVYEERSFKLSEMKFPRALSEQIEAWRSSVGAVVSEEDDY